ncbi:hypothetical protein HHL22_05530 [Hymenobacter sp. RP-2-7]|uniref:Lipopolysaccharide biosynthesis protein n=1 Tax=Hymenobacter polaris TaxID=2682546 RepID=A0A7Y0AC58_9BACT|nr:hypothetical protein [Hymenobacter polaris]NML64661.1 hypothetical protein [Hymenobacter polaris]
MADSSVRSIWQGFVRGSLGTGLAVGARAAGVLMLNKLMAVLGGPGGLTALAQFQSLMSLFASLPVDGIQAGATARLAPLRPGSGRYRAWLGAGLLLTAGLVGAAGLVLLAVGGAEWPLGRVLLFTLGMLLLSWQGLLLAALLAAGHRAAYVRQSAALSLLGTGAAAGALALGWPLGQVLLAYVLGQALTLPLAGWAAARAGLLRGLHLRLPGSLVARMGLLRFVLMAVGVLLFGRAVDYAVRAWLLAHYGAHTDLWQAVAKLSDTYTPVVTAVLSTVLYPQLAALAGQPRQAQRYLGAVLALLALGLGLALGAVYGLRGWLLPLLFAPRLLAAQVLLGPQLLGDWAKFLGWVLLYPLLARARPLPYLAVQAASAVVYVGLLAGLLPRLGLRGMVLAHAGRYGLMLAACLLWELLSRRRPRPLRVAPLAGKPGLP